MQIYNLKKGLISFLTSLYHVAVNVGFPRLSALTLFFLTKKIGVNKSTRVLCLGRSIFKDDVEALVKYSGKIQYLYFSKSFVGFIVRKYLTYSDLSEFNYHVDDRLSLGREKAYSFTRVFFLTLKKVLKFDAVMVCNFGYVDQQEFVKVARDLSIPVIVLYKEGMRTPDDLDKLVLTYKAKKTQCDLFLCSNAYIMSALINNKIDGLNENNVKVVGVPRLDFYANTVYPQNSNQIVFFSFYPDDKFQYLVNNEKILDEIRQRSEQFHCMVVRYAVENPSINVIVKTKLADHYVDYVKNIVSKEVDQVACPSNLFIINRGKANELIANSMCVLGSNSTVLLEALYARKPIICPRFIDILKADGWDLFEGYEELVHYIDNYQQLRNIVNDEHQYSQSELKLADKLLKKYIYRHDGNASNCAEKYISEVLNINDDA